ncbi:hypothetical protein TNIN_32911 [Trichonephila inaurata madagascariensis]|uniref:Uncharacterized protein n=1 Tax=Trichonephila inaurata madagascariensis TaxID=2747483 RepID=A0A8X7CAU1_9ARAC|nr:hypothetical protein TNIN_32911 [Trichonephila inaurata madagascariensis]
MYKEGDLVAIQRTQFGTGLKLRPKFLGPYKITKVNSRDRYEVEKSAPEEEEVNCTDPTIRSKEASSGQQAIVDRRPRVDCQAVRIQEAEEHHNNNAR